MKIAFLSFYSGRIDRGVEVATAALAKGLSKKHDITIFQAGERITSEVKTIQLDVENKWPEDSSSSFLRPIYADYYSRKIVQFTKDFLPYLNRYKYDVVIPTNGGWQVAILRLATKMKGSKLIVQGSAGIGRDDLWQLMMKPDHYVAISPQGYSWAKQKTKTVPVTYIPFGVDVNLFKNAKPKELNIKKPIILCVATFLPYKQIDLLIKATSQVKDLNLVLIGHGPEESNLRKLAIELINNRFHIYTTVSHAELPEFYKMANVFSLPSKATEALGIVYIEAMAAGLPVVCPDDYNRRQIVGDAGVFVDPTNTEAYSTAIKKVLLKFDKNKAYKQSEQYSWKKIVNQYEIFLEKL